MLKKLSKRTKVMGAVLAGVLVIAIGFGVWGVKTGKIQIKAAEATGTVKGYIARSNTLCPFPISITIRATDGSSPPRTTSAFSNNYQITGVPIGKGYYIAAVTKNCGPTYSNWGGYSLSAGKCAIDASAPFMVNSSTTNAPAVTYHPTVSLVRARTFYQTLSNPTSAYVHYTIYPDGKGASYSRSGGYWYKYFTYNDRGDILATIGDSSSKPKSYLLSACNANGDDLHLPALIVP